MTVVQTVHNLLTCELRGISAVKASCAVWGETRSATLNCHYKCAIHAVSDIFNDKHCYRQSRGSHTVRHQCVLRLACTLKYEINTIKGGRIVRGVRLHWLVLLVCRVTERATWWQQAKTNPTINFIFE